MILQKFSKGKSDAYNKLICIVQLVHFQIRVGVFNCQQILKKISFVIFYAEMLQQISRTQKKVTYIMCVSST